MTDAERKYGWGYVSRQEAIDAAVRKALEKVLEAIGPVVPDLDDDTPISDYNRGVVNTAMRIWKATRAMIPTGGEEVSDE